MKTVRARRSQLWQPQPTKCVIVWGKHSCQYIYHKITTITINTSFPEKAYARKADNLFTKRAGLAFSYRYSSFRNHLIILINIVWMQNLTKYIEMYYKLHIKIIYFYLNQNKMHNHTFNTSFRDKTFTRKEDNLFTKRAVLAFSYQFSTFCDHIILLNNCVNAKFNKIYLNVLWIPHQNHFILLKLK